MADTQTNTVILKVSLDEGQTEKQLAQLVLDIEATKKAQQALNAERRAGKVADEEFAAQTVKLKAELKAQQGEQTALTKNLDLYRTASGELGNTYKGVQAQLSLAQNQYKLLEGSQDTSSASAKALSATIDGLRGTLKATDEQQGLFVRNIGNYPKGESLEPLIQQLVHLQEVQKQLPAGSAAAAEAQKQIGFQFGKLNESAAGAGLTQAALTNKLQDYGERIRPATQELAKLTVAQDEVARSAGKESEEFAKIGFQIGQASQQIKKVPADVKGVTASITDLDGTTGVFGGRVAGLKNQFNQAKQGIELARGGFVGLKGAIAATGLGLLILTLVSLYEYFTKTDEGAEDLAAGMAYLKGIVSVLESVLIGAGKALVQVFKDPRQAASDFIDFLESQVVNRVKSFGVIWDAIRNGDAKGLANGIIQFQTGVEDGIGKVQRLGAEMKRAAGAAYDISRAKDQLEDAERAEIVRTEKYRNEIDRLVLTAKDRSLSEAQRLANLKKAGQLETELLQKTTELATEKLRIQKLENAEAERTGKISDEQRKAAADAEAEVVRLAGQSASLQQSIQNRRSSLLEQEAAARKALADKAEAARKAAAAAGLKRYEEEMAAQEAREKAAGKYLDDQLKGDMLALASAEKKRAETKAATEAAYQRDVKMLERNLDDRRVRLETSYATNEIDKKQYEAGLTLIEEGGYAARLLLAKHHNQDVSAADKAQTRAHNAELLARTEKEKAAYAQRVDVAVGFGQQVGALFADTLSETGATLEEFAAKALILILDSLEKQVLAQQAAATAASLAQPDSVATFGATGLIRAAVINGLIIAAFETAKAVLSTTSSKQFADGTVLDGPSHANGGIELFSPSGHHFGQAEGREIILTKGVFDSPLLFPLASQLNVLGGGKPLMPRAHMAVGGVASSQAAGLLRGDLPMVDPRALGLAVAAALRKNPPVNRWVDYKKAEARNAFTDTITNA